MDGIDLKILEMLQRDGRVTLSEMAKATGVVVATVGERIRKLEEKEIIAKYVGILNPEKVNRPLLAFIWISIDKPVYAQAFLRRIKDLEDVLECYHVTGEMEFLLKVRSRTTAELEALINRDLRSMDGVAGTRTCVALSAPKEETRISLKPSDLK